jgi:hypothetical protein
MGRKARGRLAGWHFWGQANRLEGNDEGAATLPDLPVLFR